MKLYFFQYRGNAFFTMAQSEDAARAGLRRHAESRHSQNPVLFEAMGQQLDTAVIHAAEEGQILVLGPAAEPMI